VTRLLPPTIVVLSVAKLFFSTNSTIKPDGFIAVISWKNEGNRKELAIVNSIFYLTQRTRLFSINQEAKNADEECD
jgi:hypothetical protein